MRSFDCLLIVLAVGVAACGGSVAPEPVPAVEASAPPPPAYVRPELVKEPCKGLGGPKSCPDGLVCVDFRRVSKAYAEPRCATDYCDPVVCPPGSSCVTELMSPYVVSCWTLPKESP